MLGRAVHSHAAQNKTKTQQPLNLNASSGNLSVKAAFQPPLKRKLDRSISTTSSLGALHEQHSFNENDFEDDLAINLTNSPDRAEVKYPTLPRAIAYPTLPPPSSPAASQKQTPVSSVPVPWSSSPAEHKQKPISAFVPPLKKVEEEVPPRKRRVLPWGNRPGQDEPEANTPPPKDKTNGEKYLWNATQSAVKDQQKEFRRKNAPKQVQLKVPTVPTAKNPNAAEKIASTHLSEEQRGIARAVVDDGKSVFFTGSAGTGKSVLMRSIIAQLRMKFRREPDRLAITASTGLAACVIEGTTLHSWAGIGLGKEPVPELVKKIKRNQKSRNKWMRTKVLIVDEISMVDGELFDKLENIARTIRNNGRPFGGIQLVVTGDFFQLPPVPDKNTVAKFAFDAATWNTCIEHTILLTHVFRQKDPVFADMLNQMRLGRLTPESVRNFQKLSRPLTFDDDIDATELFPTRGEVDAANNSRMMRLSGQSMNYEAMDSGIADVNARDKILANFLAPEKLVLKKGAQVMLIKNIDNQLVNGTLGKVMSFMDEATYHTYKDDEDTHHTAYGTDKADSEEVKAAKARFNEARARLKEPGAVTRYWPMVRFPLADGTVRDLLLQPEEWKTEAQNGEIVAKRSQVPLILAWALSIHKAQGQTLSRVKVDLGKVFERGQAYVALSRATSQEGLQVLRFDQKKVMVHPKVITFYEKLVNYTQVAGKTEVKQLANSAKAYEKEFVDVDEDEELYMYG